MLLTRFFLWPILIMMKLMLALMRKLQIMMCIKRLERCVCCDINIMMFVCLFVLSGGNSKGFGNQLHGEGVSVCSLLKHSRVWWSQVVTELHVQVQGLLSYPKYTRIPCWVHPLYTNYGPHQTPWLFDIPPLCGPPWTAVNQTRLVVSQGGTAGIRDLP